MDPIIHMKNMRLLGFSCKQEQGEITSIGMSSSSMLTNEYLSCFTGKVALKTLFLLDAMES